ncbi:protein of unknown function [Hyphomicrobium sp. 1Nfss2.1]
MDATIAVIEIRNRRIASARSFQGEAFVFPLETLVQERRFRPNVKSGTVLTQIPLDAAKKQANLASGLIACLLVLFVPLGQLLLQVLSQALRRLAQLIGAGALLIAQSREQFLGIGDRAQRVMTHALHVFLHGTLHLQGLCAA